jgi:Plavaka transposase
MGKKDYVNFTWVVWHKAFYEILDLIRLYGKTGNMKDCGDNVLQWLWPILLILNADYEEQ